MDIIKCTDDNTTYNIWEFIKLSTEAISHKRRHLICPSCGAKAYYRKRSTDGKPACFGARPHNAECDAATSAMTLDEQNDLEDVNKVIIANDAIRVNFDLTISAAKKENEEEDGEHAINVSSGSTKEYTREPSVQGIASRGLKTLLNYMIRTPDFQNSDTKIYLDPNFPPRQAKDLFIKLDNAEPTIRPHFFWGMISHADKSLNWLNTSGKEGVSIPIAKIKQTVIEMSHTNDSEDFAGAHVMVFGWCKKSESGKLYIDVAYKKPCNIFIKLPKRK